MTKSVIRDPLVIQMKGEDFLNKFKFHPEELIAEGMCGDVVKIKPVQKPAERRVVKKFTLLDNENKARNMRMFRSEVQFMQSFSHPYLMPCLLAAECTEYLAICMYYCPRGTLDCHVGELTPQLSEICVTQVACALRYMHKNHVAHIDVKLDNIFIDSDFNAILGDFGLAKELPPHKQTLPLAECGGTTAYLAPELRVEEVDDKEINPYKVDSYCLGVVFWALIMERKPEASIKYYREARRRRDLPTHIRGWLLKLLERNPARRLTVTEFLSRLKNEGQYRYIINSC